MEKTHFFLAVPLHEDIRSILYDWTEDLQQRLSFKRWVHPQDYHITLAFLGYSPQHKLDDLKESLKPIIAKHKPFSLEVTNLGTFGQVKRPRILWCGTSESQYLTDLHNSVYKTCVKHDYSLDKRKFKPHITLARKWHGEGECPSLMSSDRFQLNGGGDLHWKVNQVVLYQTHMKQTPKYEPLEVFELKE